MSISDQNGIIERPVAPELDDMLVKYLIDGDVVPWIGAGFSRPLGLPTMPELLKKLIKELHIVIYDYDFTTLTNTALKDHTKKFIYYFNKIDEQNIDYASIASSVEEELVPAHQQHHFYTALRNVLKSLDANAEKYSWGHYFLSTLNCNWIVTTNYDRLIERDVLPNAAVVTGQDVQAIDYYHRIQPKDEVVFKLHGDIGRPVTIPFTDEKFETLYNDERINAFLVDLITKRSLLFIGTSLSKSEKYYDYLKELFERYASTDSAGVKFRHFALLHSPMNDSNEINLIEKEEREKKLNKIGITPIWYESHPNDVRHTQVFEYLANLAASVREKIEETKIGEEKRVVFAPRERDKYLSEQLNYEKSSSVITFVTAKLTNAIAQEDYIKIDCVNGLMSSRPFSDFGESFEISLTEGMLSRRTNIIERILQGKTKVRALCSKDDVKNTLDKVKQSKDKIKLERLIQRYEFLFQLTRESQYLEIRMSDGFPDIKKENHPIDSYALILSPYSSGKANLAMAFATQANDAGFQTHLFEVNTPLVRERTARAEEMWWTADNQEDSINYLSEIVDHTKKEFFSS